MKKFLIISGVIIVIAAVIAIIIVATRPQQPALETRTITADEKETYVINAEYAVPVAGASEDVLTRIQNAIENPLTAYIDEFKVNAATNAESAKEWFKGQDVPPSEIDRIIRSQFINEKSMSVGYESYESIAGAAHGMTIVVGDNYSMMNGEEITIQTLVAENNLTTLSGRAREKLYDILVEKGFDATVQLDSWALEGSAPTYDNYQHFYFDGTGITFAFNPYQVGPYALGIVEIPFAWNEVVDIVNVAQVMNLEF